MRLFGLLLLLLVLLGCRNRQAEVVGTWTWDDEVIHFESDGQWGAYQANDPSKWENMSGSWSSKGDTVTLTTTVIDPPNAPDLHFTLSKDGRQMVGTEADAGRMTKH